MKKTFLLFSFLLTVVFTACEERCGETECANDPFLFTIFREDGMDLHNDPGSGFKPESVKIYFFEDGSRTDLEVSQQQNQDGKTLAFQTFLSNEEVTQYFFSTNISMPDTIKFEFQPESGGCCPSKSINSIYQNSRKLERENDGYSLSIPAPSE